MKKFFYVLFFTVMCLELQAQVYPYSEDFQSVTPSGSCFGDCSGSATYLSSNGWTGADIAKWKVNDNYGNPSVTPAKGLGVTRFSIGASVTTLEIITPLIGAITSSSVIKFDYKILTGALYDQAYTLQAGEYVEIQMAVGAGPFNNIHTIDHLNHTATASVTPFTKGVSSAAGNNVKFKFIYKRNDTGNNAVWIFTMDNIKVEDAGPDAGAIALSVPPSGCGFTSSMPVSFKVKNYGGTTLTNVPVQVSVNSTNYSTTVAGPISPGDESPLQTVNVDLSATTTYTITAQTQLVGDSDASNDATSPQNTTHIAPIVINATNSYSTSFETGDSTLPNWTIVDGADPGAGTSMKWQTNTNRASSGTASMYYSSFNQTVAADDWVITPCLQLQTGKTYEVSYKVAVKSTGAADYAVKLGNSTVTASFTTTLYTTPANYSTPNDINSNPTFVTQRHTFTVPSNGIYYLAWHTTSGLPIFADEINIDQVLVKELKAVDAELISFDTPVQNTTNCYTANEDVKVTIRNSGTTALTNITVTVNVTGVITQTLSQVVASLAPSTETQVTVGQIDMTTQGAYTFASSVSVTGDEDTSNDALASVSINSGASSAPVASVDFTGYTGTTTSLGANFAGWYEKRNDPNYPTSGDAAGSYWTNTSIFNSTNGTSAKINLFTGSSSPPFQKDDMIVSPLLLMGSGGSVSFKVAVTDYLSSAPNNMGSDDSFKVVVITNCGVTQTTVHTISIANSNVPDNTLADNTVNVDLSAYNGQIIQIAFVASTGTTADPEDYDFHLDDINITGAVIGGFTVNLGPDQSLCASDFPITLDATVTGATNYAWTRNGSPIGGNTPTLTVTEAGTYEVAVTKGSITKTDNVVITQKPDAVASFTHSVNNLEVTFTNTSTNASSYTWDFGDSNTSTAANPTYTYANAGTYTVTLTAVSSQGCADNTTTSSVTVTASPPTPPTAIQEDANDRYVQIYPNPNTGKFRIKINEYNASEASVELTDLLGRVVWSKTKLAQEEDLHLNLPQGLYILTFRAEGKTFTKRIQIIR